MTLCLKRLGRRNAVRKLTGLVAAVLMLVTAGAGAVESSEDVYWVPADRDDDDGDGRPDTEGNKPGDAVELSSNSVKAIRVDGDVVRLWTGAKPVAKLPFTGRLSVQGLKPGAARIHTAAGVREVAVLLGQPVDGAGRSVDMARSHASLSRTLPAELSGADPSDDADALRWRVVGPPGALPKVVTVSSFDAAGEALDQLTSVPVATASCPADTAKGLACVRTPMLRLSTDAVDRTHPSAKHRTLLGDVGGRIVVSIGERKLAAIRVGGPRRGSVPIERLRGKLRVRIVRAAPGAPTPLGGADRLARAVAVREVQTASALWGQCGIHFGTRRQVDVAIVDPPPPSMLAVGCGVALPAGGGTVRFKLSRTTVQVETVAGTTPIEAAGLVAARLRKLGYRAHISPNPRIGPGALRSADILVRSNVGKPVAIRSADGGPLSTDPALDVCLGEVDLSDGLEHFYDLNASAGTIEERALIKGLSDSDPATIEVFIVPSFSRSGRIGESFILGDQGSIRNAVVIDETAVFAGARSYTLAHELGHIFLDMPGHPDDFGVDFPGMLMDSDSADPTIFGPRRLSRAECARAVRQSGPGAAVPLLTQWPLATKRKP